MFHKRDPQNLKPCSHMETLVSAHADGELTGLAKLYTEAHIKGCPQCQSSLPFLQSLKERLNVLEPREPESPDDTSACRLAPERWEQVEQSWALAEAGEPEPNDA